MSAIINLYLSVQILFCISYFILTAIKLSTLSFDFRSQLRASYFLIILVLAVPLIIHFLPGENPFGPIAKVWSEELPNSSIPVHSTLNFRVVSSTVNPSIAGALPGTIGISAMVVVLSYIFGSLLHLLFNYFKTSQLLRRSFLIKGYGKVRIWTHETIDTPFSFFNGEAHVVLPYEILEHSKNLKIIIAHELQHHRQNDTQWVYALEFIKVLFAINPFVGKFIKKVMELQELACDEALVGRKNFSTQLYGECLYDFAKTKLSKLQNPAGAVGMATEAKLLKRRIQAMFQQKNTTTRKAFIALLSLSFVTMAGTAWAFRGAVTDQQLTLSQAQALAQKTSEQQDIPIVVDAKVLHWLNKAVGSEESRKYMRESLVRMQRYESMISEKLEKASYPRELLAVPLIESGFRNDVRSTMKAAGIWQFIPGTARLCGLEVSENYDERLDPARLTDAAVCYYQKLYAIFQNWHVALSAYNIGERRMLGAIADAGHNDVLKLGRDGRLGSEGGNYLPKLMAGMIILNNPELVQ